jgi:hypothetical protein
MLSKKSLNGMLEETNDKLALVVTLNGMLEETNDKLALVVTERIPVSE